MNVYKINNSLLDYKNYDIDYDQIGTWFTQIDEPVRVKEATNIILNILEAWMRIT
jgi:hypothetical protein